MCGAVSAQHPQFAVAYLAVQKVGAIAVSASVMLVADELRYLLQDSGSTVLFTHGRAETCQHVRTNLARCGRAEGDAC